MLYLHFTCWLRISYPHWHRLYIRCIRKIQQDVEWKAVKRSRAMCEDHPIRKCERHSVTAWWQPGTNNKVGCTARAAFLTSSYFS